MTRTTVLNLVDRLEKRGWLKRESIGGVYRYRPTLDRATAEARLATGFMAGFFGGSPTQLVQSLLGSGDVSSADIDRLRQVLVKAKQHKARGGKRPPKGGRSELGKGASHHKLAICQCLQMGSLAPFPRGWPLKPGVD